MPAGDEAAKSALPDAYRWAEAQDPRLEALSITLVRPDDERAIAELRPRSRLPDPATVSGALHAQLDMPDFAWGSVLVQTDSLEGWATLIEPNGWAATLPGVIERLSQTGVALSVFWNVNAVMSFAYARGGVIVRTFDPLLYDAGDTSLPEEADLSWGTDSPRASALSLMERLSGVRIEQGWLLDRSRPTFVVPLDAED